MKYNYYLPAFPLEYGKNGETYIVERLTLEDAKLLKHLHDIGFVSGAKILVESMNKNGMIVRLNETRLALDRETCNNIFVKEYIQEEEIAR